MTRWTPLALFALLAWGGISRAEEGECCGHCGCKMHCQVMCEWATCKVLRYKFTEQECPPPCCECCDDRWILGCAKPIRTIKLKPYEETKKYLVGQYVVKTCHQCGTQHSAPLPAAEASDAAPLPPLPPPPPVTQKAFRRSLRQVAVDSANE